MYPACQKSQSLAVRMLLNGGACDGAHSPDVCVRAERPR